MKVLVVPDIHEDLAFLRSVVESEHYTICDKVVFLGDYFDNRAGPKADPAQFSSTETAKIIRELKEREPDRIDLLCGNHDITYLALQPILGGDYEAPFNRLLAMMLDGFNKLDVAKSINEVWDVPFWHQLKCAVVYDGVLYSHAGIHLMNWPNGDTVEQSFAKLEANWSNAVSSMNDNVFDDLFVCGQARGGLMSQHLRRPGGPLWLDWNEEFEDSLPLPQIVGHTRGAEVRRKGRSYCLDCGQSVYGVVTDGILEIVSQ